MSDSASRLDSDHREPAIAVVGCGRWGANIVRDLVTLHCIVIAIDPSTAARRQAMTLGASGAHARLEDYIGNARLDGIVIAAPTRHHATLAGQALRAGVPVFVEKPLTDDVVSAQALVELGCERLFVMHKWHYHPGIELLAELAAGGSLGTVHGVTSERTGEAQPSRDTDALWLLGPHEVTIGARIIGSFPDRVEAVADTSVGRLLGVAVIARWDDGRWHHWTISVRPGAQGRRVLVHGSKAQAVLSGPYVDHVEIHVMEERLTGAGPRLVPISTEPPLLRELRTFRDHLLGGPPPPTPGWHGLAAVTTVSAVRRSAGLAPSGSVGVERNTR